MNPTQIQQKCEQRYASFLSSIVTEENFFPIEFPVGSLPKEYIALREAVTQLIDKSKSSLGYGYTLELENRRTQKYGLQSLPKRILIDNEKDYLKLIKKEKEVLNFKKNEALIRVKLPELISWLVHNPLKVI
ncbi:MAG: DUF3322 domain-containing protein, partial [Phormidium sp.]